MNKRRHKPHVPVLRSSLNGLCLTAAQDQVWRAANDDLASDDFARRRRGQINLRALETELAERQAGERVEQGIEESIALERGRGERVEIARTATRHRRIRIRSRDGHD